MAPNDQSAKKDMQKQRDLLRFEQTEKQIAKEMALYGNPEADNKQIELI